MQLTKQIETTNERSGSAGRSLAIDEASNQETLSERIVQSAVSLLLVGGVAAVDIPNRALTGSVINGQLLLA